MFCVGDIWKHKAEDQTSEPAPQHVVSKVTIVELQQRQEFAARLVGQSKRFDAVVLEANDDGDEEQDCTPSVDDRSRQELDLFGEVNALPRFDVLVWLAVDTERSRGRDLALRLLFRH